MKFIQVYTYTVYSQPKNYSDTKTRLDRGVSELVSNMYTVYKRLCLMRFTGAMKSIKCN